MKRLSLLVPAVLLAGGAAAQHHQVPSFAELMLTRNRPAPYTSTFKVRAGAVGSMAEDKDPAVGLDDDIGLDGFLYLREGDLGDRKGVLDAYAGRDGAYFGLKDDVLLGGGNQGRLEGWYRYFPFYREGFYRGDDFVPTGRFEGDDWGLAMSIGRDVGDGVRFDAGAFYRQLSFDRNEDTLPSYRIPDDYAAYGFRAWIEHDTLALSRITNAPEQGFLATVQIEYELNDSDTVFGTTGVFESELPRGLWRGEGKLEWYVPQGDSGVWEIWVRGAVADDEDRVHTIDAQKPIGHLWFDGTLGFRLELGSAFTFTPFVELQYVHTRNEDGVGSSKEFFYGAGVHSGLMLGNSIELIADYSYLTNPSREPVTVDRDIYGEHRFFVGFEITFGGS
jgi:hypothetical protein